MTVIGNITPQPDRSQEDVLKIRDFAKTLGFLDLPAEKRYDVDIAQLYMEIDGSKWQYELDFSIGVNPYGTNAWLSATNHDKKMAYNIMSLYNSAYRYIVKDVNRFLFLLETLKTIRVKDFYYESIEMYLDNWYNNSLIESLP